MCDNFWKSLCLASLFPPLPFQNHGLIISTAGIIRAKRGQKFTKYQIRMIQKCAFKGIEFFGKHLKETSSTLRGDLEPYHAPLSLRMV